MGYSRELLHHSPAGRPVPEEVVAFAERAGYDVIDVPDMDEVLLRVSRAYPGALVIDGSPTSRDSLNLCGRLKRETFTAVVPLVVYVREDAPDVVSAALECGADEVLTLHAATERESALRLELALRRAERDVSVHPTTLLPGTIQIERDFGKWIASGRRFAVCYADLDHFKEFNDRYGYYCGDRVILVTSRILRDVVRAHAPDGFVGHIGGDDFIFTVPLEVMEVCCEEIIEIFDLLMPLQYNDEDRARGHYTGRDRRGNEYRVPLMTLSIGVVTNGRRTLAHTAEISQLAAEMKMYAKSFEGSLFKVDRRTS